MGQFYHSDPLTLDSSTLKEVCAGQNRFRILAVYEWARLYPNWIVDFLLRLEREEKSRLTFEGCYAELQVMFKRLLNVETIELQVVDESIIKSIEKTLVHQKNCLVKVQ